jgi:hypothetical protein
MEFLPSSAPAVGSHAPLAVAFSLFVSRLRQSTIQSVMDHPDHLLLTPNQPNVFIALSVPQSAVEGENAAKVTSSAVCAGPWT